jgi:hypothetical protein
MARLRHGQESSDEFAGASAFPFSARKACGINKCADFAAPVQKTFLIEAIESGHDRRVGEWARQLIDYLANVAVATRPEDLHNAFFKMAEGGKRGHLAFCGRPSFPKIEHFRRDGILHPDGRIPM